MNTKPMTRALAATTAVAAAISLSACSTSTQLGQEPTTTVATGTATSTVQPAACQINSTSAALPTAEPYRPVPADARISVTMSGVPAGYIKPGDPPTEVEVTLCNDSPVDYPAVGVNFVITKCSCATSPMGLPEATADRFDAAANSWIPLRHPVITTGMDYLGAIDNVAPLPKGKEVKLRYRFAIDASMTAGRSAVEATAVMPDPLVQIGKADLPFIVHKDSPKETTPPPPVPKPGPRQSVLPFKGLTYPSHVAVDSDGNVYTTDYETHSVQMLSAGSNDQRVLPFEGIGAPGGLAVTGKGDVYITDTTNNRVLELGAGQDRQSVLPFTGLDSPQAVAVDADGNVYVGHSKRVVKLASGTNEQTVLPFTDLGWPGGIGVDGGGAVFVSDRPNNRVFTLAKGLDHPTSMSVGGIDSFAVDAAGDIFFADDANDQVEKRTGNDSTTLPIAGLYGPTAVAVDDAGNVYVADNSGFGRIVKLAAV